MRAARVLIVIAALAVLLAPSSRASAAEVVPDVQRLAGATRYDTAATVAASLHPDGATTAVVAAGTNFPDALTAGVAAAALDAPLFLASSTSVPVDAIKAMGVRDIVLIGGTAALPGAVAQALQVGTGASVRRVAGANRYETASAVGELTAPNATIVLEASGDSFETALVAAVHASRIGARLELAPDSAPGRVRVGDDVLTGDLGTLNDALIARFPTTSSSAIVTTIESFPDALAATVLAGALDAPVLFTRATSAGAESLALMHLVRPTSLVVVGGSAAVPDQVLQQLFGWAPLPPAIAPGAEAAIARDLFVRMNAERAARHVAPLVWDGSLELQAIGWAREMAGSGTRHGALPTGIGEDIHHPIPFCDDGSCFLPTSGVVHRDWMQSNGNRDNVVEPGYVIVGIGISCAADGSLFAVARFGVGFTPLSDGGSAATPVMRSDTSGVTCTGQTVDAQPWWPVEGS